MENNLQKRYGFWTATAMVIGIVIGSGVFFKAEKVLTATGGDLTLGILAWILGGAIMVACAYTFAILAGRFENVNGIVAYAEASFGKTYGYMVGWFMTFIYYPALTGVLAWVSARYTAVLFGCEDPLTGVQTFALAGFYLVAVYALNALSPILSGKFQVSTTVIKLIPLILIAVFGIISGLTTGQTMENFSAGVVADVSSNPFLTSVVATCFAYEGWIIATSINAELRDSKKNLPRALLFGTIVIVVIYVGYFIGLSGALPTAELMAGGDSAVKLSFVNLLGDFAGSLLFVFVVISCLGTLNGLMMGNVRGIYALACRKMGPLSDMFSQVDGATNMPSNSGILGMLLSAFYLFFWYGNFSFLPIFIDISEIPIVTMYALYIPIFIWIIKTMKELNVFNRYIMPSLAILGSLFMIFASFFSHGFSAIVYLVLFTIVMIIGYIFKGKNV